MTLMFSFSSSVVKCFELLTSYGFINVSDSFLTIFVSTLFLGEFIWAVALLSPCADL